MNFGVLPLTFADPNDYDAIKAGAVIRLRGVIEALAKGAQIKLPVQRKG